MNINNFYNKEIKMNTIICILNIQNNEKLNNDDFNIQNNENPYLQEFKFNIWRI